MPELDPRIEEVGLEKIAQAIAGAFSADDLREALIRDLELDIDVVLAAPRTQIGALARELMTVLSQRGWVLRYLRAARRRRPENPMLIAAIQQYCPAALQEEPKASESVDEVIDVLERMKARLADPEIAAAVNDSRVELGSLASGLARLRVFKGLHDILQRFQVSQYSLLNDNIKRLRTDPQAAVALGDQLLELKMTFKKARSSLRSLDSSSDTTEETSWLDIIDKALDDIRQALNRLDDRSARQGALMIRGQLQSQPSRINGLLRTEARGLPLTRLGETIATASDARGLTLEQRGALKDGVLSVIELRMQLQRKITDHNHWQLIETQLWFLDEAVASAETAIEDFKDYWQIAKKSILPLWNADPKADWVVATRECGTTIDNALDAEPPETALAKSQYRDFRSQALWQFFSVDGDLSDLCENVLQIGAPIAGLLKGN